MPNCAPRRRGFGGQILQRFGGDGKEQIQGDLEMGTDKAAQCFGHREGEQEVGHGQEQARLLTLQPGGGIGLADFQAQALAQTQAAGVDGGEASAMIQGAHRREHAAHFGGGEDDGQFELGIGPNQFQFVGPLAFEGFFPEELDGADGLRAGLAGDLLVSFKMDAILADLLGRDQIRRFACELAELADTSVAGLFGALTHRQELEVVGEGIKDGVRGTFFICMGWLMDVDGGSQRRLVCRPALSHCPAKEKQSNHPPDATPQHPFPPPRSGFVQPPGFRQRRDRASVHNRTSLSRCA